MSGIYNSTNEINFWNVALYSGRKFASESKNFLIENRTLIATIVIISLAIILTLSLIKLIYDSLRGRVTEVPNRTPLQTQDLTVGDIQKNEEEISLLSPPMEYINEEKDICLQLRILDDSIQCFEELDFYGRWRIQAQDFDSLSDEIEGYECHGGKNITNFCQSAKKELSNLQIKYKLLSKENLSLFPLPDDVQRHIFRYCSNKTIGILSSVSKRINRLANTDLGKIIIRQHSSNLPPPLPLKETTVIRANFNDGKFTIENLRAILQIHSQKPDVYISNAQIMYCGKILDDYVVLKTLSEEKCLKKSDSGNVICFYLIYNPRFVYQTRLKLDSENGDAQAE